jgi:ADP-ribose pyrophosphatase YjhB (NUDIX family)
MKLLATLNENNVSPTDYTVRQTVRAVILDGTKVLFFGNNLVGGGVEEGETDEEALHREAMEEAGATIEILKPLGEVIAFRDALKKKYVVRGYACSLVGVLGVPTTTDVGEQKMKVAWIEIDGAIKKLEHELVLLASEEAQTGKTDLFQVHRHMRNTALILLKELFKS